MSELQPQDTTWLVGDVGGTNVRFGLVSPDGEIPLAAK